LLYNWRRVADSDEYPHYARVRESFVREYERLLEFVNSEPKAGELVPEWCEVTYINHLIPEGQRWEPGAIEKLFTLFRPWPTTAFLSPPEQGEFALTHLLTDDGGKPLGRLHITLRNAVRRKDSKGLLVLELTARGRPDGEGLPGVLQFMDRAHEWVVRGFTEITTPSMHEVWGSSDA
jgi:uncharacterized protein (TIGR04255 family)